MPARRAPAGSRSPSSRRGRRARASGSAASPPRAQPARTGARGRGGGGRGGRRLGPRGVLALLTEGEPEALETSRVEAREHVRLVLRGIGGAMEERPPAVLRDARVVAGREPVRACLPREGEQLG